MSGPGWWRRPARRRAPVAHPPAHVRVVSPAEDMAIDRAMGGAPSEYSPADTAALAASIPTTPDPDEDRPTAGWVNADGCPCTICTPPEIA